MGTSRQISVNTLGVLIGLELSILWILMGLESGFAFKPTSTLSSIVTLGARRHTIMTIAGLILIPICAREVRWGFLTAVMLGLVTFVLTSVSVIELIAAPAGEGEKAFGPVVWVALQIPIMLFGYRAHKEVGET